VNIKLMQRTIAAALVSALIITTPGPRAYAALSGALNGAASASSKAGSVGAVGARSQSSLGTINLNATLSPVTLSPTLGTSALLPTAAVPNLAPLAAAQIISPTAQTVTHLPAASTPRTQAAAGPKAITRKALTQMGKQAAPHIAAAAAAHTSPNGAYNAGVALNTLLTQRQTRPATDVVPTGMNQMSGFNKSGLTHNQTFSSPRTGSADVATPQAPAAAATSSGNNRLLSGLRTAWSSFTSSLGRLSRPIVLFVALAIGSLGLTTPVIAEEPVQEVPAQVVPADPEQQAAAPLDTVAQVKPLKAETEVVVTEGTTVGEPIQLKVTVSNTSDKPVTVQSLRGALTSALPNTLEIEGETGSEPITLAPGESRTVTFDLRPWDAGELKIEGAKIILPGADARDTKDDIAIDIPTTVFNIKSVLTPDWKDKGFRDLAEIQRGEKPSLLWLLTLPLGLLLLIISERILASRRTDREAKIYNAPLWGETRERLAELNATIGRASAKDFYGEIFDLLHKLTVDLHGVKTSQRSTEALIADLNNPASYADGKVPYNEHQLAVIASIARESESARYDGLKDDGDRRRRLLNALEALADNLEEPAGKEDTTGKALGLAAIIGGTVSFAHPWVFLLALPVAAFVIWRFFAKRSGAHEVADANTIPGKKSVRQRARWALPLLRGAAILFTLLALAKPQIGVERQQHTPPYRTVDTAIFIDGSGSMSSQFGTRGKQVSKIEGARQASRAYIIEQRRGTNNRVAVGVFRDDTYLAERLTTDYDVLLARLKEVEASGSTAVGKSILSAITHFIEANAYDLDSSDPRVEHIQKLVDEQKSMEALAYARNHPDLLEKILQPGREKIVVVFSDGGSNTGISPLEAAKIARNLGIRIYTVGIGTSGSDEQMLQEVSDTSGGLYYNVNDPDAMRKALLDISRLEKSPHPAVYKLVVKDYQSHLILLALLLLGLEMGLGATRLRSLQSMALLAALGFGPNNLLPPGKDLDPNYTEVYELVVDQAPAPGFVLAADTPLIAAGTNTDDAVAAPKSPTGPLSLKDMPREMREGNALYFQGQYDAAIKKYAEALANNPEINEIYFNLGNAYLRLGDLQRASRNYTEYLNRVNRDPKKASLVYYNLGNAAIMQRDLQRAIGLYREALRQDTTNQDAKWNLEVAMQMLKQQQQQQGEGKPQEGEGKPQEGEGKPGEGKPQPGEGKPGEGEGQPGEGEGQPGEGKPSDGEGQSPQERRGQPTPGEVKEGVDGLIEQQGGVQDAEGKKGKDAVPRSGTNIHALAALPILGAATIGFQSPLLLWIGLIVVPIVAGLMIYALKKRMAAARRLSPLDAPKSFRSWQGRRRWMTKFGIVNVALLSLAITAGDPIFGEHDSRMNFGGQNITMAVDGSPSMLHAEDGRYDRMKTQLTSFLDRLEGTDRVGLVVFAGKARTASGLSIDYSNFEFKIRRLREREANGLGGGSNLAAAIKHAIENPIANAKKIGDRKHIIIVISDGEIFDQELNESITLAQQKGIAVYTIGVGSTGGSKIVIPQEDENATPQYMTDSKTGQPVVTTLNEGPLRALATQTGGAYFRATEANGIDDIMAQISSTQDGNEYETIRTPQKVGKFFMWPALLLLLLDLMLPNATLLRRRAQRRAAKKAAVNKKKKDDSVSMGGFALLGVALPLSVWPQILPFAALFGVVAGLILFDIVTDRAITRRIYAKFTRSSARAGLDSDLHALFDNNGGELDRFRTADLKIVRAELDRWHKAKTARKPALIKQALKDGDLWRQKLLSFYLNETLYPSKDSGEHLLEIETALQQGQRLHLAPVEPVLRNLIARRKTMGDKEGELAWLSHMAVLRSLATLSRTFLDARNTQTLPVLKEMALEGDPMVRDAAEEILGGKAPSRRPSWVRRAGVIFTSLFLAAMLGLTTFAGMRTIEYSQQQAQAQQLQLEIFWGDDQFVLRDVYEDERITRKVIPVLEKWNKTDAATQEEFNTAIEILRDSPDPRADNILEAMFKQAHLLPLTEQSLTTMLRTLVERDNDQIWKFMQAYMAQNAENPAATKQLLKMIEIGAEVGSDRVFRNLFYFLTSPNQQVRGFASQKIRASLNDPARSNEFLERLTDASNFHATNPALQMWVQFFVLDRLSQPGAEDISIAEVDKLLTHAMQTAKAFDGLRLQALKAGQVKIEELDKLPPPLMTVALGMMKSVVERAEANGGASDALKTAVEFQVYRVATGISTEGVAKFPGLKDKLIAEGLMEESETSGYGGPRGGYGGEYGEGGYTYTTTKYLDHYTIEQLQTLKRLINEEVASEAAAAGEKGLSPEKVEFIDRTTKVLDALIATATTAGVPSGATAGYQAAQEVNVILHQGNSIFLGTTFLQGLREKDMAPDAKMLASLWRSYQQNYTREEIIALRDYLSEMLASGKRFDPSANDRNLNWKQKKYLAEAMGNLEAIADKHFPLENPSTTPASLFKKMDALATALASGDVEKIRAAELAVVEDYNAAPVKDLFLAKLHASRLLHKDDAAVNMWILTFITERYAQGDPLDTDGVQEVMDGAFSCCMNSPELQGQAWAAWVQAFRSLKDNGKPIPAGWLEATREHINEQTSEIGEAYAESLPAGSAEHRAFIKAMRDAYIYKQDDAVRDEFNTFHLRALHAAVGDVAHKTQLQHMIDAAEIAGVPDGGSAQVRAAEEINDILHAGYSKFPGRQFIEALRDAGLVAPGTTVNRANAYADRYTADEAVEVYNFFNTWLTNGKQFNSTTDLSNSHKELLIKSLPRLKRIIEKYYPSHADQVAHVSLIELYDSWLSAKGADRASIEDKISAQLQAADQDGTMILRLGVAQQHFADIPQVQEAILNEALVRLGSTTNSKAASRAAAVKLVKSALEHARNNNRPVEVWNILETAIANAENSATLNSVVITLIKTELHALVNASEAQFPGLKKRNENSIIRANSYSIIGSPRLKHLRVLEENIAASITAAEAKGALTAEQLAIQTQAAKILPKLTAIGTTAGMLPGDTPGEAAAVKVNALLQSGYQKFAGQDFSKLLARDGLAPARVPNEYGTVVINLDSWKQSYTPQEIREISAYLKALHAAGEYVDLDGKTVKITPTNSTFLNSAVAKLDGLAEYYPVGAPDETVLDALHLGYMKFPAQDFVNMAAAEGVAPPRVRNQAGNTTYSRDVSWKQRYTLAEVNELRAWYQRMIDAGTRLDASATKLTATQLQALRDGLAMLDNAAQAIEAHDQAKVGSNTVRGFSFLGLPILAGGGMTLANQTAAAGSVVLGAPVILAILGLIIVGIGLAIYFGRGENEEATGPVSDDVELSDEVLSRFNELDLKARKLASSMSVGQFRALFKGPGGLDFAELAQFQDDDIRDINWEASAESDEIYVNRYDMLKNMPLMLVVDLSGSSGFGTRGSDKRTVIEDVAATLALVAQHKNVKVGALIYAGDVEFYLPPRGGQAHAYSIIENILNFSPESAGTNHAGAFDQAMAHMTSRGMVAVVSDFVGGDSWSGSLATLSERHDVRPLRVSDPAEERPIEDVGLLLVRDAETGVERWVDTSNSGIRQAQRTEIRRRESSVDEAFSSARLAPITLYTDGDYMERLAEEFRGR
jgi:uncharacterized protein (DUF58 family)/tetratricopeptide (TPR) repeat protein